MFGTTERLWMMHGPAFDSLLAAWRERHQAGPGLTIDGRFAAADSPPRQKNEGECEGQSEPAEGGERSTDEAFVSASAGGGTSGGEGLPRVVDGIAMVHLVGPLTKGRSMLTALFGGTSMVEAVRQLRAAERSDAVSGVLLRIDSPGGTAAGSEELATTVRRVARTKPVYALAEDLVASAAYKAASQATRIYAATRGTLVGSIGTVILVADYSKMFEELGIAVHAITSGPHKAAGALGTRLTPAQRSAFQQEVDGLSAIFFEMVERGRGIQIKPGRRPADGAVYLAGPAKAMGLIDGIAPFDAVMDALRAAARSRQQGGH